MRHRAVNNDRLVVTWAKAIDLILVVQLEFLKILGAVHIPRIAIISVFVDSSDNFDEFIGLKAEWCWIQAVRQIVADVGEIVQGQRKALYPDDFSAL